MFKKLVGGRTIKLARRRFFSNGLFGFAALGVSGSVSGSATAAAQDQRSPDEANVRDFGALGDGSTDDFTAFAAASAALGAQGGTLRIPAGAYRLSRTLHFSRPIKIRGDGIGQNAGKVNGALYPYPRLFHGSRLIFDRGVEGLVFHPHTRVDDIVSVNRDVAAQFVEQSSAFSSIEDVAIISLSYDGRGNPPAFVAGKHGIRSKTRIYMRRLFVCGFADNNVEISAGARLDYPSNYGNANSSVLEQITSYYAGNHGFHAEGGDTNIIKFDTCDATSNGGWGFNDESFLGNLYLNCHAQGNNKNLRASATSAVGSFRSQGPVASSMFIYCYVEGPTSGMTAYIDAPASVIGGSLATQVYQASTAYVQFGINSLRQGLVGNNQLAARAVHACLGRDASQTSKVAFSYGTDLNPNSWRLRYEATHPGIWAYTFGNAIDFMEIGGQQSAFYSRLAYPMAVGFPQGLAMGTINSAPRLLPVAAASPTSGTYRAGDTIFNSAVERGAPIGWRCSVAGSPGNWLSMGRMP